MELADICERFDERLDTADYAEVDASANGLQVGPADREVERAAVAVDAAEATAEAAADAGVDLLVTHHGVSWGGIDRVTGTHYRRVAPLIENDVALYVSHLPLDGHPELGNAARIADLLELEDRTAFGTMGPVTVGQRGELPTPRPASDVVARLRPELDTGAGEVHTLDHGPDRIGDVAVVTGSGADFLGEAAEVGADLLVTGEGKQQVYHESREAGVGVVLAGHYATETFGVRALGERLENWGVEVTFLDHPTGI
jgi:dinuclear metal center YbgI/SA1388 family protein